MWAFGDDTYGQCGRGEHGRPTSPPFHKTYVVTPTKIQFSEKILKIASGKRHNLAIDAKGRLFGWGQNNIQQLSHSEEFSLEVDPKLVLYEPT